MSKPLGPYKRALKEAEERANAVRVEKDGMVFHEYPDYETYKDEQVAGNKAKNLRKNKQLASLILVEAHLMDLMLN